MALRDSTSLPNTLHPWIISPVVESVIQSNRCLLVSTKEGVKGGGYWTECNSLVNGLFINLLSLALVRELHREFALCGADVLQAFVFNGTDDRLNAHRDGKAKLNVCGILEF